MAALDLKIKPTAKCQTLRRERREGGRGGGEEREVRIIIQPTGIKATESQSLFKGRKPTEVEN